MSSLSVAREKAVVHTRGRRLASFVSAGRPSYPPGKPSSKEIGCSGGNPAATWRAVEMIACVISPRAPLCLSEIKSGHIRDAIRRGPGGKEYARVCTENLIRVDDVMESPKLAE